MSFRNSVAIVASPRPRVGKTLLARLLTDFHLEERRSVAAFDLNAAGQGTLAQFLPEHVTRSAIDDLEGQMALFDRLVVEDGAIKIIDVGRQTAHQSEAYRNLCSRLPEAMPAPVHNEIFGVTLYGNKYAPIGSGTVVVRLLLLALNARKYVERPPFSFADPEAAALDVDASIELRHWLQRIYREFQELDQRILLTDLKSDAAHAVTKR